MTISKILTHLVLQHISGILGVRSEERVWQNSLQTAADTLLTADLSA